MLVVRAIQEKDLDALLDLAGQTGGGMTTLKPDRASLQKRIAIACASFAQQIPPLERDYLFVMEDLAHGRLAGTCAIKSAVGLDEPFYNYRLGTLVHSSKQLKVLSRLETLYLSNDLTGSSELCSLFLHPDYRNGCNGKLLLKSRMLFIAQFPDLFSERLCAEMRGYLREDGSSPFWDSLGQHFFRMDFARADGLSGTGMKAFIAELMPRHPLYVAYLPPAAREVIGQVHVDTAPARRMLEQEGLHYEGYVDIFDAGPVLQARVSELRALRESVLSVVESTPAADLGGELAIVANTELAAFRALASGAFPHGGRMALTPLLAAALGVASGATVRSMPVTAPAPPGRAAREP